jgi:hypothetical protein
MEKDLQPLLFERLSTFATLHLDLRNAFLGGNGKGVLDSLLDCGLGQLASLEELTCLKFCYFSRASMMQQVEMEDAEWMVNNWERLREVEGRLNHMNFELDGQLKSLMESQGINTR